MHEMTTSQQAIGCVPNIASGIKFNAEQARNLLARAAPSEAKQCFEDIKDPAHRFSPI
jgi:hypothetical protein